MTEDPIRDGGNWYSYCDGNPVRYVDPSGLKLRVHGSGKEKQCILNHLNILSRDVLKYSDDGFVYVNVVNNATYNPAGTDLIREIISNDNICDIFITSKGNRTKPTLEDWENASNGGTNVTIYFNANKRDNLKVYDPDKRKLVDEKDHPYIALGHECIHALREMKGSRKRNGLEGIIMMEDIEKYRWHQEEYDTTGINYIDDNGVYYDANNWKYTENSLRREHRLKERLRYY